MTQGIAIPTPLFDLHQSQGAKLTCFSGYSLPLWYRSAREEHLAVRQHAGVFDISHMGVLKIDGVDSRPFLDRILTNSLRKADQSIMTYAMALNETGGILDDVMVGSVDGEWLLVVNASNTNKILEWLAHHQPKAVSIAPLGLTHAFVAVQGPSAVTATERALGIDLGTLPRFGIRKDPTPDIAYIMRTGYTGEDGVEIVVKAESASELVHALIDQGITPCGLAARDSLRIEAGLPLYGHELSETLTPLNTRYGWVVNWKKDFIGKSALRQQTTTGITEVGVGLRCDEALIPRQGYDIVEGGTITSGTLAPNQSQAVALAQVPLHLSEPGTRLTIKIRNKLLMATVTEPPFFRRTTPCLKP